MAVALKVEHKPYSEFTKTPHISSCYEWVSMVNIWGEKIWQNCHMTCLSEVLILDGQAREINLPFQIFIFTTIFLQVKSDKLDLTFVRGHVAGVSSPAPSTSTPASTPTTANGPGPFCRYVNVELVGGAPSGGAKNRCGTVLLENPRGDFPISWHGLQQQVGAKYCWILLLQK